MEEATTITKAAQEFINRRDRSAHPDGKTDKGGRWYPSESERCSCCSNVRSPSRAFPWSYMTHCRTAQHVANLFGVNASDLRKEARRLDPPAKPKREGQGGTYFKAVALVGERLLSIFDGSTEYVPGLELREPARQKHGGGFYVYRSPKEALRAAVPKESELYDSPRVILSVKAEGQYCVYENGKLAFSRITPIKVEMGECCEWGQQWCEWCGTMYYGAPNQDVCRVCDARIGLQCSL